MNEITVSKAKDVILHIPHSSGEVRLDGFEWGELFSCSEQDIRADVIRSTDWFTDDLFGGIDCERVVFPHSRLLVDVERFMDDADEPMASVGRGMIYTSGTDGRTIRGPVNNRLRNHLLALYKEHHDKLSRAVDDSLAANGRCLIIDAHSFPFMPWCVERDKREFRPDICIGTDPFHTPLWLQDITDMIFSGGGFMTMMNRPYAGTIVPLFHLGETPRLHSVMIEVNRVLYCDERRGEHSCNYDVLKIRLQHSLRQLVDGWRDYDDFYMNFSKPQAEGGEPDK